MTLTNYILSHLPGKNNLIIVICRIQCSVKL